MKTKINLLLTLMLMIGFTVNAQNSKTEKIKVYGNCGMCKTRIEKTANSINGVTMANWDKDTKMLVVSFNDSKTNVDQIETAIAKVGHDTPNHRADDKVYEALPACCHYDRAPVKKEK